MFGSPGDAHHFDGRYHHFEGQGGLLENQEQFPPPLAADLNGDGKAEVITAAPGGALQILAPRRPGDGFAQAEVLAEVSLATLMQPPASHSVHITSFRTGYLTPLPKELVRAPRKQVIVVVTSTLHIFCLDHNLKVMWQQNVLGHFPNKGTGTIRELAIHISEHSLQKNDRGVVVIGASIIHKTLADMEASDDVLDAEMEAEEMEKLHAKGRQFGQGSQDLGEYEGRHFSYFAFEGSKGEARWKHDAEDWHRDIGALADEMVAQHGYHMTAERENALHYGEASCRDYREAVLNVLPHSWHYPRDTSIKLAHFEKHRAPKGAQKERLTKLAGVNVDTQKQDGSSTKNPIVGKVVGSLVSGAARGARRGANKHNTTGAPNVLIAHLEEGIEAIHLYSGRTVCRLHLATPGLHVDLNRDGVPDHIVAVGGDPRSIKTDGALNAADHSNSHQHHGYCYATVSSGIPPRQHLFDGSICRPFRAGIHGLDRMPRLGPVEVAPPIVLPIPGHRGHYLKPVNLAVFLNSRGEVSAYDERGHLMWQVRAPIAWTKYSHKDRGGMWDDDELTTVKKGRPHPGLSSNQQTGTEPTLVAMALRTHAIPTVILAGGLHSAAIISEHGSVIEELEFPEPAEQPLVIADFNFDGLNDVIIVGEQGLYGWAQVRQPGAVPYSTLVGGLIVIMVAVWVTQQGFMQSGGKVKGRSTERVD